MREHADGRPPGPATKRDVERGTGQRGSIPSTRILAVRRLDALHPRDRRRIVARLVDLDTLDTLVRERGTLAGVVTDG